MEAFLWPAGFLVSLDDFYLLGSGLMMTQTSNNIFNSSLFDAVTPNSLLAWQRVRLAHSLAHTGEEWAKTFSRYNSGGSAADFTALLNTHVLLLILSSFLLLFFSFFYIIIHAGTYNNQYMVLDRSKVKLGQSLADGALTVVEQIPGLVEYSDQTQALRRGSSPLLPFSVFCLSSRLSRLFFSGSAARAAGHWPSYNVPFHPNIYALSGYGEMWEKHGEDFSYDLCPRAKIFRRDQADVKDLDSLKHMMRFNGA